MSGAFIGDRASRFLAYFEIPFSFVKIAIVSHHLYCPIAESLIARLPRCRRPDCAACESQRQPRRSSPHRYNACHAFFGGVRGSAWAVCEAGRRCRAVANITWLITFRIFALNMVPVAVIVVIIDSAEIRPGFSPFTTSLQSIGHHTIAKCFDVVVLTSVVVALHAALNVEAHVFPASLKDSVENGRCASARSSSLRALKWRPALAAFVITLSSAFVAGVSYPLLVEVAGMLLVATYGLFTSAVYRASAIPLRVSPWIGAGRSTSRSISLVLTVGFFALLLSMAFVQSLTAPFLSAVASLLVIACGLALAYRAFSGGLLKED